MMIGIQSLMKENKNQILFWDFSQLSIEELEDIVGKYSFFCLGAIVFNLFIFSWKWSFPDLKSKID